MESKHGRGHAIGRQDDQGGLPSNFLRQGTKWDLGLGQSDRRRPPCSLDYKIRTVCLYIRLQKKVTRCHARGSPFLACPPLDIPSYYPIAAAQGAGPRLHGKSSLFFTMSQASKLQSLPSRIVQISCYVACKVFRTLNYLKSISSGFWTDIAIFPHCFPITAIATYNFSLPCHFLPYIVGSDSCRYRCRVCLCAKKKVARVFYWARVDVPADI